MMVLLMLMDAILANLTRKEEHNQQRAQSISDEMNRILLQNGQETSENFLPWSKKTSKKLKTPLPTTFHTPLQPHNTQTTTFLMSITFTSHNISTLKLISTNSTHLDATSLHSPDLYCYWCLSWLPYRISWMLVIKFLTSADFVFY